MSQFGFFNTPQPQPQPAARPVYDAFPASHSAFEVAPRRYEDPYARAPSPRRDDRGSFYGAPVSAGRAPSPRRDDRASFFGAPASSARAHSPPRYFAPASSARAPSPPRVSFFGSAVSAPRAPSPPPRRAFFEPMVARAPSPPPRGAYYESPAGAVVYAPPGPMDARAAYLPAHDPPMPAAAAFFQPINGPMMVRAPAPAAYETRDAYPREASWRRASPPREERREFFGSTDTWRSAPRRSPPRDGFNSEAFGRGRDYSPERRKSFRDDRSPVRRDRSRFDDKSKKDHKERRSHDDRDRKRDRERSEDRKRDDRKDKSEKDRKSRDRDSREKERSKENGEKKRRVDDKKEDKVEETDKPEDKNDSKPEDTGDETENNDEEIKEIEVIEEDEFGDEFVDEEKEESNGAEKETKESKKEEPKKSDYKESEGTKKSDNKKVEEKLDWKSDRTRIRSPSIEKKSRSSSIEKDKGKKEYSEFKIITDASFDEIHRPFERPYGNFNKSRNFPTSSTKYHSGDDSWYQQYKAKVMMTKTATYGLSGPPSAPLHPPVVPMVAPLPAAYVDPFAAAREVLARMPPRDTAAAYPPAAPPRLEYPLEYARASSAYGAPPAHIDRHEADPHRVHEWTREERDAYQRRRADELRSISPPTRRDVYDRREEYPRRDDRRDEYDRRDDRRDEYERRERREEGHHHVEYFTERYRSEQRPDERAARYADHGADRRPLADERPRYREHSPAYEHSAAAQPRDESRHPPARPRPVPSPTMTERLADRLGMTGGGGEKRPPVPPPVEEIDASKLVEPLEDDGWDAVARLLNPEKVVVEKKAKKPLIASMPPPPPPAAIPPPLPHRPIPRDPPPVSGFFSQPVPSVRPKIAFADSKPFYKKEEHPPHSTRPSFFPAPTDGRVVAGGVAPPRADADAYGRATSYEELASSNGAATYRSGPAPGWESGRRH